MRRFLLSGGSLLPLLLLFAAAAPPAEDTPEPLLLDDDRRAERHEMVDRYLAGEIEDVAVLGAMKAVPRHRFVPDKYAKSAYYNRPMPIGHGQTISQPYIVAKMTELLQLTAESRVLEIGTGSGYQAAVLAELAGEVYSIEILEPLAKQAAVTLESLGYEDIRLRVGDGYAGWPEAAPFTAIIVTCAPEAVPAPLREQLAEGGRLVIPVGERGNQELIVLEKHEGKLQKSSELPVRFVPMVNREGAVHGE